MCPENACEFYYYALQDANYNVLGVVTSGSWGARLVERYEYTPYGQRTVYSHGHVTSDINNDGYVGLADSDAVLADWNQDLTGPDPSDLSGDGYKSLPDLDAVFGNWNKGISPANNNDPLVTHPRLHSARFSSNGVAGLGPALCEVGHQGLFHDEEFGSQGGLIHNRARTLHPRLGRFVQRDPFGYVDGMSLYQYIQSKPVLRMDPTGQYADITAHRADKHWEEEGKYVGHEWIEIGGTYSAGFWPTGSLWGSKGEIKSPDPYEGDRSGPMWQTVKVDTTFFGLFNRHMYHPERRTRSDGRNGYRWLEDVGCCKDKSEPDVIECIKKWADYYDLYEDYHLDGNNCRTFVQMALTWCCLEKQ